MELPFQPIKDGRFVPNRIVELLLETSTHGMTSLARKDFTDEERTQFAQLIGYSVGGFCSLSYVSDDAARVARAVRAGFSTDKAEVQVLRDRLHAVKLAAESLADVLGQTD